MKEDFLHYVWKWKRFRFLHLTTTTGTPVELFSTGEHNHYSGPDFLNARIKIDGQLWAGNVEIHVKASDWYLHGHEKDSKYDTVILHVVWEDDVAVFRRNNSIIPTLALKELVPEAIIKKYRELFRTGKAFINCEDHLPSAEGFLMRNWLERLYVERLEEKSASVFRELEALHGDWEAVLFRMLMKNFGLNVNGEAFYSMAKAIDYTVIRKLRPDAFALEALFLGLAGLLEDDSPDRYQAALRKEYTYLKHKFRLLDESIISPEFSRLRPANFPTIRLSQLAALYAKHQHLFSMLVTATGPEDYHRLFGITTSSYWETHYTFGKSAPKKEKKVSGAFIRLLIINTVLPLKFCYSKYMGKEEPEALFSLIRAIKPESNRITERFRALSVATPSAMESQSLLQLYHGYCSKNKCLHCAVGTSLMRPGQEADRSGAH